MGIGHDHLLVHNLSEQGKDYHAYQLLALRLIVAVANDVSLMEEVVAWIGKMVTVTWSGDNQVESDSFLIHSCMDHQLFEEAAAVAEESFRKLDQFQQVCRTRPTGTWHGELPLHPRNSESINKRIVHLSRE